MGGIALSYAPLALTRDRPGLTEGSPGLGAALALLVPPLDQHPLLRELEGLRFESADAASSSAARAPGSRPQSVLIVLVDTLRGDALPPVRDGDEPFGKAVATPYLDSWLQQAFRFQNAYSQASKTKASIPPMFRSLEPFEDVTNTGQALSDLARELGLRPVAVVPQYFLLPAQVHSQELLQGFESVDFYEKNQQEKLVPEARHLFEELGKTPFLAWVHFYNMHGPYFWGEARTERVRAL